MLAGRGQWQDAAARRTFRGRPHCRQSRPTRHSAHRSRSARFAADAWRQVIGARGGGKGLLGSVFSSGTSGIAVARLNIDSAVVEIGPSVFSGGCSDCNRTPEMQRGKVRWP